MKVPPAQPQIMINIDHNDIGGPARIAAKDGADLFALAYTALNDANLTNIQYPPPVSGVEARMRLEGRDEAAQRKHLEQRLIAMCIGELAQGIRASLEEAAAFIEFIGEQHVAQAGMNLEQINSQVQNRFAALRVKAQGMPHPLLLQKVQDGLSAPLQWSPELSSFQKVRNCLEHRGGVVGDRDIDETGLLVLKLPALGIFLQKDTDNLVPLPFGQVIEDLTPLVVSTFTKTQSFHRGDVVQIAPGEIPDIAFAVWMLADDLVSKLPGSPPVLQNAGT